MLSVGNCSSCRVAVAAGGGKCVTLGPKPVDQAMPHSPCALTLSSALFVIAPTLRHERQPVPRTAHHFPLLVLRGVCKFDNYRHRFASRCVDVEHVAGRLGLQVQACSGQVARIDRFAQLKPRRGTRMQLRTLCLCPTPCTGCTTQPAPCSHSHENTCSCLLACTRTCRQPGPKVPTLLHRGGREEGPRTSSTEPMRTSPPFPGMPGSAVSIFVDSTLPYCEKVDFSVSSVQLSGRLVQYRLLLAVSARIGCTWVGGVGKGVRQRTDCAYERMCGVGWRGRPLRGKRAEQVGSAAAQDKTPHACLQLGQRSPYSQSWSADFTTTVRPPSLVACSAAMAACAASTVASLMKAAHAQQQWLRCTHVYAHEAGRQARC